MKQTETKQNEHSLIGKPISETFKNLVQFIDGKLYDGLGNEINIELFNEKSLYSKRVEIFCLELNELQKQIENNINDYLFKINNNNFIEMEEVQIWYSKDYNTTNIRFIPKERLFRRCDDDKYRQEYKGMQIPEIKSEKKI